MAWHSPAWSAGASLSNPVFLSEPLKSNFLPFRHKREEMSTHFPTSLPSHQRWKPGSSKWSGWGEGKPTPSSCLGRALLRALSSHGAFFSTTAHPGVGGLMLSRSDSGYSCVWGGTGKLMQAHSGPSSKLAGSGLSVRGYFHLTLVLISWWIQSSDEQRAFVNWPSWNQNILPPWRWV